MEGFRAMLGVATSGRSGSSKEPFRTWLERHWRLFAAAARRDLRRPVVYMALILFVLSFVGWWPGSRGPVYVTQDTLDLLESRRESIEGALPSAQFCDFDVQFNPAAATMAPRRRSKYARPPDAFLAITSRSDETSRRKTLRTTMLMNKLEQARLSYCFFVTASSENERIALEEENSKLQDMVLLSNVRESYSNLTLVTLSIFAWARKKELPVTHLMKVDSDVYIRFDRLDEMFGKRFMHFTHALYAGSLAKGFSPYRTEKGPKSRKWVISEEEYPYARWPPYMFGSAYILSMDLVKVAAECLPRSFACFNPGMYSSCEPVGNCPFAPIRFEDATVGGIVAKHVYPELDLDLKDSTAWDAMFKDKLEKVFEHNSNFVNEPWDRDGKACTEHFLAMHRFNETLMHLYNNAYKHKKAADFKLSLATRKCHRSHSSPATANRAATFLTTHSLEDDVGQCLHRTAHSPRLRLLRVNRQM
ncbi:Beta-1,3-galactosyltransferase 5 [Porphyridium purpureum]|uniref:Hexosyltransferase n=1 Tax=Porphyridium purpureum TaxID=35688 RepID=A0A5J4YSZ0_PORPP|nr:Beta-1,3-galactosyltransferase 5 [Porphyridium purpureum]|eukprot:POR6856..scf229_5